MHHLTDLWDSLIREDVEGHKGVSLSLYSKLECSQSQISAEDVAKG